MSLHRSYAGIPKGDHTEEWVVAESTRSRLDRLQRLFNRLENAITHHKNETDKLFADAHDEALYKARDKILRDAHEGKG